MSELSGHSWLSSSR